jgi:hypothetical protein
VLQSELDKARAVVVVWSSHSVASRWVKAEAGEGLRRGILVPVLVDASLPPLGFRNILTVAAIDGRLRIVGHREQVRAARQ